MPSVPVPSKDVVDRLVAVLSSPMLNVLVGITGVAIPVIAWGSHRTMTIEILLGAETLLVLFLVISHIWLRRTHIFLRRPASRAMSDPRYFGLIRSRLESDLIAGFGEIADGHLLAYSDEVPRLLDLMLKTLIDSPVQPKRALATDLAPHLGMLPALRWYFTANRRLIEAGGKSGACSSAGKLTCSPSGTLANCKNWQTASD